MSLPLQLRTQIQIDPAGTALLPLAVTGQPSTQQLLEQA